jgi:hypothetical protein
MDKPDLTRRAARNASILAAEATFRGEVADIVSLVLRRAHGGDPVCLRLALERVLPAGRIPLAVELAPDHDPGTLSWSSACSPGRSHRR